MGNILRKFCPCLEGVSVWRTPQDYAATESYTELMPLAQELYEGDVVLIKGSWLLEQWKKSKQWTPWFWGRYGKNSLPKRQELPTEAVWSFDDLAQRMGRPYGRIKVVSISYCWLTPDHPDPHGKYLQVLGPLIEQWYQFHKPEFSWDLALFIDWCSLMQEPMSGKQKEQLNSSLQRVHLWFASQWTDVWLMTKLPPGKHEWSLPYGERGWPTFEQTLSSLCIKASGSFASSTLDLGRWSEECTSWELTEAACTVRRTPLIAPKIFIEDLHAKEFGNPRHRQFVEAKYHDIFNETIASVKDLCFQELDWDDVEADCLAEALKHCARLENLFVSSNCVGDMGAESLAIAIQKCPSLRNIALDRNVIRPKGAFSIAMALPQCPNLEVLDLSGNYLGDEGSATIAQHATQCRRLHHLALGDNGIGTRGIQALSAALPKIPRLEKLNLSMNKFGDDGVRLLVKSLPQCRRLQELWVDSTTIKSKGGMCFAESVVSCKSLTRLSLRDNCIGDRGAEAFIKSLPLLQNLQYLHLAENDIHAEINNRLTQVWLAGGKKSWNLDLGNVARYTKKSSLTGAAPGFIKHLTEAGPKVHFDA